VTQTRPGSTPLGRTVGLVAPTPAEYRQLGTNEAFLAALRTATGGAEVVAPTDPWIHDLRTTSRSTDLWPLLLVLALLLWPLDIALRRVSIGRRDFAAAGAWVRALPRRRRATAARNAAGEGLLAARSRATSAEARAAMRRAADPTPAISSQPPPILAPTPAKPAVQPPEPPKPPAQQPAQTPAPPSPAPAQDPAETADTLSRLREAKRRARER
jgi:hypothetical protein